MVTKKKAEMFQPSGDVRRVQSLNNGQHIRIFDHLGKSHHLSVERDADLIAELVVTVNADNPELARRIVDELTAINAEFAGFGTTLEDAP
jgi:hypothetical protein